jgi:hypothetical protein
MFDWGFAVPGCPCTYDTIVRQFAVSLVTRGEKYEPEIGRHPKANGTPNAIGKTTLAPIPIYTSFLVRSAGKMRRNMNKKHSLLKLALRK